MHAFQEQKQKVSLSDYLAAERTLLAWIRTGLALMGFGFVVARFGVFLQQVQFAQNNHSAGSPKFSFWNSAHRIGCDRESFCRIAPPAPC